MLRPGPAPKASKLRGNTTTGCDRLSFLVIEKKRGWFHLLHAQLTAEQRISGDVTEPGTLTA